MFGAGGGGGGKGMSETFAKFSEQLQSLMGDGAACHNHTHRHMQGFRV